MLEQSTFVLPQTPVGDEDGATVGDEDEATVGNGLLLALQYELPGWQSPSCSVQYPLLLQPVHP